MNVKAPNFKLISTSNEVVELNKIKSKLIVLYFYPKDMTPGCTTQSCNLRDNYQILIDNRANNLYSVLSHHLNN